MTAFQTTTETALHEVDAGRQLPRETMRALVEGVLEGLVADDAAQAAFAALLVSLANRGEAAAEIAGAADALRAHMKPLQAPEGMRLADTCGTGGDGSGSFNISTAAAFVVAAAGQPVAKHGNRSVSSRTGSADVLEVLGLTIDLPAERAAHCLENTGICYCHAPKHHPAMARVAPLRKKVGKPTVFNLVGPLCNPAGAVVQVIGVGRPAKRRALADAAALLGLPRGLIVSGNIDGKTLRCLDEISLFGPTDVLDVHNDVVEEYEWRPMRRSCLSKGRQRAQRRSARCSQAVEGPGGRSFCSMPRQCSGQQDGPTRCQPLVNWLSARSTPATLPWCSAASPPPAAKPPPP
jgi:anthranilate phosphoribosyltransferase